jgi:hypothetical protein
VYDIVAVIKAVKPSNIEINKDLHVLLHPIRCNTCHEYVKHFVSSFGTDGLSRIHRDLTSHWIAELDDHIQCSGKHAYNEGMDKAKYNMQQKIQLLEETII